MKLLHYSDSNKQIETIIPGTQWLLSMYDGLYLYPENVNHDAYYGLDRKYIHIFEIDENSDNVLLSNASASKINKLIQQIHILCPGLEIETDRHQVKWFIYNVVPRAAKKLKTSKETLLINLGITAIIDTCLETKCVSLDTYQTSIEAVFLTLDNLKFIEIIENN